MLSVTSISKSYNNRELFSGVSFTISMSDRIAVIGRNGTGKTTLFEIIAGNITPDSGSVSLRRDTTIGYLRQDIRASSKRTLLEDVSRSSDAINNLAHKIRLLHKDLAEEKDEETVAGLLKELGELQYLYESKGATIPSTRQRLSSPDWVSPNQIWDVRCPSSAAAGRHVSNWLGSFSLIRISCCSMSRQTIST